MTRLSSPGATSGPDTPDKRVSPWTLIRAYWTSGEWASAWALLLVIVVIDLATVWINVRLNNWIADFYNVLQAKNARMFMPLLLIFCALAFSYIALVTIEPYLRQWLGFRWRQWMTRHFLRDWLNKGAFYRIERNHLIDNPDQRISYDLQTFTANTLALSLGLLSTIVTLVSFSIMLWRLPGALSFTPGGPFGGHHFVIAGYMVWAAALYALFGSIATQIAGHPLVAISYEQQRVEADFRFGLIRLRENAEQIALYNGTNTEITNAQTLFAHIRKNWRRVMNYTFRLNLVTNFYAQAAVVVPIALAAPRYFAGAFSFGILMQIVRAFGTVSDSFSWFISNYSALVDWRATVNRLCEFNRITHAQGLKEATAAGQGNSGGFGGSGGFSGLGGDGGIALHPVDAPRLTTRGLVLALPDDKPLARVRNVTIQPGSRWLVHGPSGAGKSTLIRALAGLWPFGEGAIDTPANARAMFIPQQSYLPIGTLKAALAYPSLPDAFDDATCEAILRDCGLGEYTQRLQESGHWARILSPGEQQRLAGARVLLHRPDYLFLDEATSALDTENEARLYGLFIERLPQTAIVSIAHRESLAAFHDERLEIRREG